MKYIDKICYENEEYSKFEVVYEIIGYIMVNDKRNKKDVIQDVIKILNYDKIGWKSDFYEKFRLNRAEEDEFIVNPIEVEEGVSECGKCGSKRVYSYQKQTRSADEPMTSFFSCLLVRRNGDYKIKCHLNGLT